MFQSIELFLSHFSALMPWLQFNQCLHGKGISGHRQCHLGDVSMSTAEWIQSHNFAGISPRTISAMNSILHSTSGI